MFRTRIMIFLNILFAKFVIGTIDLNLVKTKLNICDQCGTELINNEDSLLFLSTLDGSFIGVNHRTGNVIWQFKEEAAVKVPVDSKNALTPIFLPDPRDGSLYLYNSENHSDLKKLQLSIQQLVTSSPCRSTDGIFYTGKKVDNWFMVDWRTGIKEELLDFHNSDNVCPVVNRYSMFLGRTEYNLIIHDISRKDRKWNVTFYDYTAKIMPEEKIKNYEHLYFAGSSTGKFAVMKNAGGGSFLWEADFKSPIIGAYLREGDGIVSLPFTTMDDSSMNLLNLSSENHIQLFSTLYIGEHTHGLYALPAVATAGSTIFLLNGPSSEEVLPMVLNKNEETTEILGYYKMPEYGIERLLITGRSDAIIEMNKTVFNGNSSTVQHRLKTIAIQTDEENSSPNLKFDRYIFYHFLNFCFDYVTSERNIELKVFMATMLVITAFMFVYFRAQMRDLKQSSSSGSSRNSFGYSASGVVTAVAEELPNGSTRVGKILFDSNQILGKGCEGTFVFKGQFDSRNVAVKRLLPECFTVADREVCLLRESDQHPHVVRYFCMEQDKQFRYIALELCAATLQDYTEKDVLNDYITPSEALAQATAGLEHLHALDIVHRDIKPHNVLLSFPSLKENEVRAMISDFGLCKKLQTGRVSFSRKSGITGTDGWIAPEMVHGRSRTTTAVDIFSLGCVFYYVLSKGKHPFGDSLRRQSNIMSGEFKVNEIVDDKCELWSHLITKMVTIDPSERPSINIIKNHPAFWSKDKILTFLQDVSDRIEKEEPCSKVMVELEMGNSAVLNGDWRNYIEPEIADDLCKYRSYRADSVRDLLRALRNKKHHYRELSHTVRNILGSIPDEFVTYWTDRFPKLLLHTWLSMQCVKNEDIFVKYYCSSYTFPRINDNFIPLWIQQSINLALRKKYNSKLNNKYTINRYISTFLLNGGEKTPEYNWRNRSKVSLTNDRNESTELRDDANSNVVANNPVKSNIIGDDVTDDITEIDKSAVDGYPVTDDISMAADKLSDVVQTIANKENYATFLSEEEVNEIIDNAVGKLQKNARHKHRGRNKNRKKQTNSNVEKE